MDNESGIAQDQNQTFDHQLDNRPKLPWQVKVVIGVFILITLIMIGGILKVAFGYSATNQYRLVENLGTYKVEEKYGSLDWVTRYQSNDYCRAKQIFKQYKHDEEVRQYNERSRKAEVWRKAKKKPCCKGESKAGTKLSGGGSYLTRDNTGWTIDLSTPTPTPAYYSTRGINLTCDGARQMIQQYCTPTPTPIPIDDVSFYSGEMIEIDEHGHATWVLPQPYLNYDGR